MLFVLICRAGNELFFAAAGFLLPGRKRNKKAGGLLIYLIF
jgi:hypothetical protein